MEPYSTFAQKLRFAVVAVPGFSVLGGLMRASGWSESWTYVTILAGFVLAFLWPFIKGDR